MKQREAKFKQDLVCLLPRLWRFGLSLAGNIDACNDLVQATCERALLRYHQWKPDTRLDSWAFSILHSIWKNELRAQSIRRGHGFVDPDNYLFDDDMRTIESSVYARQVFKIVMALPEAQRSALMLVYVDGYSYAEAAKILDVPIGTIMSRLARARIQLADMLNESKLRVTSN